MLVAFVCCFLVPPAPKVAEPELLHELLRREKEDQKVRFELIEVMKANGGQGGAVGQRLAKDPELVKKMADVTRRLSEIDARNRAFLKAVVDKYGWPGKSLVGAKGAHVAWLLAQHADGDVAFQRRCLELMVKASKGEVDAKDVAYLTDRVLANEGKKQRYGTQAVFRDGKAVAKPIEDEAGVDERRKTVGLPPLREYLRQIEAVYLKK
jgi:hypothetical protein